MEGMKFVGRLLGLFAGLVIALLLMGLASQEADEKGNRCHKALRAWPQSQGRNEGGLNR